MFVKHFLLAFFQLQLSNGTGLFRQQARQVSCLVPLLFRVVKRYNPRYSATTSYKYIP